MSDKRRVEIAIYLAFFALIMCAPLLLDPFWLNRIAKYLVFGMLGVAVALSWGYAGILNLGQGLFFGGGAYMLAMSLKLASQTSLQQGSDKPVPDFMLWNAEPGAPIHRQLRYIVTVELDRAVIRGYKAGDHIKTRCLARTVGTQKSHHLAPAQRQADRSHHGTLLEALADAIDDQALAAFHHARNGPLRAAQRTLGRSRCHAHRKNCAYLPLRNREV